MTELKETSIPKPTLKQPLTRQISEYRRQKQMLDVMKVFCIVCGFTVLGSFSAVLALLPLKTTETVFVSVQSGEQLVRLLPEQIDRTTKEQYIRTALFDYIKKRETINFVDEEERFAWVQAFTHPQWFKMFAEHMSSANSDSPLVYYSKNELTREISVQSLERIPQTPDIWRAEYIATDRKSGQSVRTKSFVATFKAYTTAIQTNKSKAQINPFGLIVENYAVSAKGKANDKENQL